MEPVVNIGMSMDARVEPIPANRVALEVNWFLALALEPSEAIMPQ